MHRPSGIMGCVGGGGILMALLILVMSCVVDNLCASFLVGLYYFSFLKKSTSVHVFLCLVL